MNAVRTGTNVPTPEPGPRQEGGNRLGPGSILIIALPHLARSCCISIQPTTVAPAARPEALRSPLRGSEGALFSGCCMRTSENTVQAKFAEHTLHTVL
jgi:hypothetical protein